MLLGKRLSFTMHAKSPTYRLHLQAYTVMREAGAKEAVRLGRSVHFAAPEQGGVQVPRRLWPASQPGLGWWLGVGVAVVSLQG